VRLRTHRDESPLRKPCASSINDSLGADTHCAALCPPDPGSHFFQQEYPFVKWLMISMAALAFAGPACADTTDYAPTFDAQRLSAEVKTLSSDAFEGRGPATAGETKTIDYVVAQMKAAGLEPGGDLVAGKRQWTQAVPLARFQITGTPGIAVNVDGKPQKLTQG
jgi:hypothetical protein